MKNSDITKKIMTLTDAGLNRTEIETNLIRTGAEKSEYESALANLPKVSAVKVMRKEDDRAAFEIMSRYLEEHFIIYRDSRFLCAIFRRTQGNTVAECLIEGLHHFASKKLWSEGYEYSKNKIGHLVDTWILNAPYVTNFPKSFSLNLEDLAFTHVQIEMAEQTTPVFDDFIQRCGKNGPALMAFIWSIFVPDDKVQQYVLMQGEGRDGKGSLMRLIEKIIGANAYQGLSPKDNHWVAKLVGKRVAYWGDVNSTTFVLSADFKSLTGGDRVTIMEKFEVSYSAYLSAKIFISTNNSPDMTSRTSDLRRCIYVRITENMTVIPDYESKLWEERSGILYKCKMAYQELFDKAEQKIICDIEALEAKSDDFEVQFSSVVSSLLEINPDAEVSREALYRECYPYHFKLPQTYSQFRDWLFRNYPVTEVKRASPHSKKPKVFYKGIKLKSGLS